MKTEDLKELKEYLKKNLKLKIRSKRVHPHDMTYSYEIAIELDREEVSKVSFVA